MRREWTMAFSCCSKTSNLVLRTLLACLHFIATVFTLAWLKVSISKKYFTKRTKTNLICCRMWIACQRQPFFFLRAQWILLLDSSRYTACNRNKCQATRLHLNESCCFSCKEITLSAFQVWNMNLIIVESNKMWQNILDTLCFQLPTSGHKMYRVY